MIKFYRKDSNTLVHVQHGVFGSEQGFELKIEQAHDYQAQLLVNALHENLNRHLKEIKEKYYNEGWKDAKAKKKKRISFFGGWKF
jgi:uncharacterized protein (DUF2164 family)